MLDFFAIAIKIELVGGIGIGATRIKGVVIIGGNSPSGLADIEKAGRSTRR